MADLSGIEASQSVKVTGSASNGAESYYVNATSAGDLQTTDTPNQQGVNTILNLTTTAVIGRVGVSNLQNRKIIEMQALTTNVKWGYDATCPFDLFKNQFFALPFGENCDVYFKASTGTAQVAISEK